jgi:hypothetical protein
MTIFYSAASRGFLDDEIHSELPSDAIEIGREYHAELMARQSGGAVIIPGADGSPIAVDPVPPSSADLLSALRSERNRRLAACDYTQLADCPMNKAQRAAWKIYRQALRELPDTTTDLADIAWPIHPDL